MRKYILTMTIGFVCLFATGSLAKGAGVQERGATFDNNLITHIGIVVRDIEASANAYADVFGVEVPKWNLTEPEEKAKTRYKGEPTQGQAKLAFFKFQNTTIELIEPVGGPSTWKDFLEEKGEGVHHIAFKVKGMDSQIALLEDKELSLVQRGQWTGGRGGQYAYVDGVPKLAVILELLESF